MLLINNHIQPTITSSLKNLACRVFIMFKIGRAVLLSDLFIYEYPDKPISQHVIHDLINEVKIFHD